MGSLHKSAQVLIYTCKEKRGRSLAKYTWRFRSKILLLVSILTCSDNKENIIERLQRGGYKNLQLYLHTKINKRTEIPLSLKSERDKETENVCARACVSVCRCNKPYSLSDLNYMIEYSNFFSILSIFIKLS